MSRLAYESRLPDMDCCIDCGVRQARPAFVRKPKDATVARWLPGKWPAGEAQLSWLAVRING